MGTGRGEDLSQGQGLDKCLLLIIHFRRPALDPFNASPVSIWILEWSKIKGSTRTKDFGVLAKTECLDSKVPVFFFFG